MPKLKFQIQCVFGREPIFPSNRANHDWGSLSGAMDDTHKSQQKCTCIPQAFWFGKQGAVLKPVWRIPPNYGDSPSFLNVQL